MTTHPPGDLSGPGADGTAAPGADGTAAPGAGALATAAPGATAGRPPQTLRRRLARTLVLASILLVVVLVVALVALAQVRDRQKEVIDTYFTAIVATEGTFTQIVDAESGLRQFVATGRAEALEAYERALSAQVTAAVEPMLEADPSLRATYGQAVDASAVWFSDFAIPVIEDVERDGPGTVDPARMAEGSALFAAARDEIVTFLSAATDSRMYAADRLEQWSNLLFTSVLGALAAAAAMGIVLTVQTRRWVVEPLSDLARQSRAVVEGHLGHHVVGRGTAEVVALGKDIEYMRGHLVARTVEMERARDEVAAAHRLATEQAEDLRRSNRDLEQFAYVASHDLQEPLRKVASFTQLLSARYSGQLDERADQYIGFAVDGAKRMQQLITDLLGFSRVGRTGTEVSDVDLGACVQAAVDNLGEAIADAGATVTWDGLPTVRGERSLLVQLLQNLIGNAVKFADPQRPPVVQIEARRMRGSWQLSCRDNGIGIDAQYVERVFLIFQRLHPKDVYEGTGIGLSLCKKIVEFHGGQIWVEPSSAQGTTISWTLPDRGADRSARLAVEDEERNDS